MFATRAEGFRPKHCRECFDRFFRVDRSRTPASGGTGLGLAIVQSIMTLHGGSAEITGQRSATERRSPYEFTPLQSDDKALILTPCRSHFRTATLMPLAQASTLRQIL